MLLVLQSLLLFWLQAPTRFFRVLAVLRQDIASPVFQARLGWSLLAVSFLIGLATLFFTYYNLGDEGDTLTGGWLISRGSVLYRDIFSHHFPFPYLWVGLWMRIFGPSIFVARLSIVILRTAAFAGAMKFSGWHLPVGLAVFSWSLISPLFLGNMLMYDSFGALLFAPAVFVTLAYLLGRAPVSRRGLAFIGGLAALAGLSDPVTVVPGLMLLGLLFLSGLRAGQTRRAQMRIGVFRAGAAAAALGLVGLVFVLGAVGNGSLPEFYRQAIWFNQGVYDQYAPMPEAVDLLRGAWMGLDVLNPAWLKYPGLYYQWSSFEELDQWIFAGLFFRLAVIGLSLTFLLRREWLAGISVYLMASTLLWRANTAWHAQAFLLFSVSCAVLLVAGFAADNGALPDKSMDLPAMRRPAPARALGLLIALPIGLMFLWLHLRVGQFWVEHRIDLRYSAAFSSFEDNGSFYRAVTCHQPDATILIYPGRMLDYLAAQIPPANRYFFLFPWVAEVGQAEVIADLRGMKEKPVMVYIDQNESVWGFPVKDYLSDLIQALERDFIRTEENVYLSPALKARCDLLEADQ